MIDLRALARAALPPIVARWIGQRLSPGPSWAGDYTSWSEAVAASTGYDDDLILERVHGAALEVQRGEAAWERDGVTFDAITISWPVLAGLLWIGAQSGGRLDVLDYGGALGTSYVQNRSFLSTLNLSWSVVEQPHFVEAGRRDFEGESLRFYASIDECLKVREPHVLLLSSVLQYLERPSAIMETAARFSYVIIDRTPLWPAERDQLTVQTVPPSIYAARYPCWLLSEPRLLAMLSQHFEIVSSFQSYVGAEIRVGSGVAPLRGLLARRR